MRSLLLPVLFIAAAFGGVSAASAADIPPPVLKAPAAAAAINWTGFYLNGGLGYGMWVADTQSLSPVTGAPATILGNPLSVMRQGGRGWLGRVGGGYDYQFTTNIVAGLFADFDFSSLKGSVQDQVGIVTGDVKQEWSWAAGARIGWLIDPAVLSYFTAGYTATRFSGASLVRANGAATPMAVSAYNGNGWFLGGGVETSIGSGWFWRTEYRLSEFGRKTLLTRNATTGAISACCADISFKPTVQTFTTQIVYKFGQGGATNVFPAAAPRAAARWSGVYVNAGAGYGMWTADTTTTQAGAGLAANVIAHPERQGGKGWLGRAGGGYDYQVSPYIVAGLLADFDFSSLKGTLQDPDIVVSGELKQKWSWSVGGRAGLLLQPSLLAYLEGGYTSARFSSTSLSGPVVLAGLVPSGLGTPAFTQNGWFVGGGTEYALSSIANGLFWRNEYRYAQYGAQLLPDTVPGTATAYNTFHVKPAVQTVTSQLVYKFN
jgi:outer membrane immunogenic protein